MNDNREASETFASALSAEGFVFLSSPGLPELLGWQAADWSTFAGTWDDLGPDLYMADGGRYRRRRHAAFHVEGGAFNRKPHQPHFQSRDYNPLNGDMERWFSSISSEAADSPILMDILRSLTPAFERLEGSVLKAGWHCEVHQFRIEALPDAPGRPTPEGLHRDGVDWVLVLLIDRAGVQEGVTEIGDPEGRTIGRFILQIAGDAVLLDDRRIMHGVTPVRALDPKVAGHRDVLVVTWRAESWDENRG